VGNNAEITDILQFRGSFVAARRYGELMAGRMFGAGPAAERFLPRRPFRRWLGAVRRKAA
jgi:hypothetical protein